MKEENEGEPILQCPQKRQRKNKQARYRKSNQRGIDYFVLQRKNVPI